MRRPPAGILFFLALLAAPAAGEPPPGMTVQDVQLRPALGAAPRRVTLWWQEGTGYISTSDLSVLLGAVKEWRPDLGRLTLVARSLRWSVTEGSDLAVVGKDHLVHLSGPAFLWEGILYAPLDLIVDEAGNAQRWAPSGIRLTPETLEFEQGPQEASIQEARLVEEPGGVRLILRANREVVSRLVRAEETFFVLRLSDVDYDPLLVPLPADHPLFQGLTVTQQREGIEVTFTPGPDAIGYWFSTSGARGAEILLGTERSRVEEGRLLAFRKPQGLVPDRVERIVLDPGHGGADTGAAVDGGSEAEVPLDVCGRAAEVLRETLDLETRLTRGTEDLSGPRRAARVGEAEADLLVSVHIHGGPAGVRAYVGDPDRWGGGADPEYLNLGAGASDADPVGRTAAGRLLGRFLVTIVSEGLSVREGGVWPASLSELVRAGVPAAMIEISLGAAPWDDEARTRAAEALTEGLRLYLLAGEAEW
jgi:N-acetylmuramoyl-L-alanine amidase